MRTTFDYTKRSTCVPLLYGRDKEIKRREPMGAVACEYVVLRQTRHQLETSRVHSCRPPRRGLVTLASEQHERARAAARRQSVVEHPQPGRGGRAWGGGYKGIMLSLATSIRDEIFEKTTQETRVCTRVYT